MQDYITNTSASFSEFLTKSRNYFKSNQNQSVVSFVFPSKKIEIKNRLNNLCNSQEVFFYTEKPVEKKLYFGINSILTITEKGEKRFSSLEKQLKQLHENFVTNYNNSNRVIPLLFGGMKFTVEHSDNDWKDFDDSDWFIPELIYFEENGESYFVYNTLASPKILNGNTIVKFENVLRKFLLLSEEEKKKELRVLKKTGNEPKDKKKWKNQVNQVLEKIDDGEIEKIVLSRKVELIFTADVSIQAILKNLVDNYPECTLFVYHKGKSSFIGASPEILAKFNGEVMQLEILAGSTLRGNNESDDIKLEHELLNNNKDLSEHNIVLDYLKNCLNKAVDLIEISQPMIKKLKNIQHIRSTIKLNLNESISSIGIIGKIHPTPSVCGLPGDTALDLIEKFESHQRGLYAGLIGWFNFYDEGELVLAIRSALITGNKMIAYAGCGIIKGSNPDAEFKETELKLKPFLSIFNNEN